MCGDAPLHHFCSALMRCAHPPLLVQISYRGAVLHHYISRSLADFEVKQARRAGDGSVKTLSNFFNWARESTAICTAAVPLGQALARRYNLTRNVPARCLRTEP